MPGPKRISFKVRLVGAVKGVALCVAVMPVAVVMTLLLMPLWSWLEASAGIEAVGHSGPAEWCYLFTYLVVLTLAGFVWSTIERKHQQGDR